MTELQAQQLAKRFNCEYICLNRASKSYAVDFNGDAVFVEYMDAFSYGVKYVEGEE